MKERNEIEIEHEKVKCIGKIQQDRQCFVDILRVAATCAVVLMHTLTGAVDAVDINGYPTERLVYLVVMDLITWCVPVFLLISGFLFLNPARHIPFSQMLIKYCRRVVLALFLFGVPYAVLELILEERTFRADMVAQGVWMVLQGKSWSHMWYLYLILGLYLVTPALKWMLKKIPAAGVYGFLAVLLCGSSILPFCNKLFSVNLPVLPDEGIYLFYYLCGYLFVCRNTKKQPEFCEKSDERKNSCIAEQSKMAVQMITAVLAVILVGMVLSRVAWGYALQMAYNYPPTILVSVLLFQLASAAKPLVNTRAAVFWQRVGNLSFAVYLVHPVFVNVLYKFLHISILDYPIGISLPVFFVGILFLSILTAWILCRIPVMKKYVL